MKEKLVKKIFLLQDSTKQKLSEFRDNKGESHLVAVIGVIIVVVVILAVIFQPMISDYLKTTVMPGLKTTTQKLFNFA